MAHRSSAAPTLVSWLLLVVLTHANSASAAGRLNDTAISNVQCLEASRTKFVPCDGVEAKALAGKQDGMVGRDATHADDADGRLGFEFRLLEGGCVLDLRTALTWEVKSDDGGPRDKDLRYTNYGDGSATDASRYVNDVNATALCGFTDWRLPTAEELLSVVDYGQSFPDPRVDTTWLGATAAGTYWTQTGYSGDSRYAYYVDFLEGYSSSNSRSSLKAVRLVRTARHQKASSRFVLSADGTEVADTETGLTWQRCQVGMQWDGKTCVGSPDRGSLEHALMTAKDLAKSSGLAWRLPNVKELASLIDRSRMEPAMDNYYFPGMYDWAAAFWASTPRLRDPWYAMGVDAWRAEVFYWSRQSGLSIRLVRATKNR